MRTAYLKIKECVNNAGTDENFKIVGNNSGNIVFENALISCIKCEGIERYELENRAWEFDNLVVRNFIWIRENEDLTDFRKVMDAFGNKPIIPISVGLQSPELKFDFRIHPNTVRILQELSERAVLAVRGYYTADILNQHGITNIKPVGCPSMYYGLNYQRKVIKKEEKVEKGKIISNYRTLSKTLDTKCDIQILNYLSKETDYFIEQTKCYFNRDLKLGTFKSFMDFYRKQRKIFFIFKDWFDFVKDMDFSIGARFHGNVVPILAGVPSLFLVSDSRTKELTDYFKFPTLDINDFDANKTIQYYYEMADYTEFNKIYPKLLDNFIEFCLENNLELTSGMAQYFYRKLH